jgi:signal transduction histidine kinase
MEMLRGSSMRSDSLRDAEKYHKYLLGIESATETINALEEERRAGIERVITNLLPSLAEALDASVAFAAIQQPQGRNRSPRFELVAAHPRKEQEKTFLPYSKYMAQVLADHKAHVIGPYGDSSEEAIEGLEIFNASTAILVQMQIEYQSWVVGVCNRADRELGPFLGTDRRALESIIKLIEIGLRAGERRRQLTTAKEIAETIGLGLNLETTMEAVIQILHKVFEGTSLCVLLYQSDVDALSFAPATLKYYKVQNPAFRKQSSFPLKGKSIACRVAQKALESKSVICENVKDVLRDPDYLALNPEVKSELCVSLMGTQNNLLGVLVLERSKVNDFDDMDEDLVKTVGQQLSGAIERAQKSEELEFRTTVAVQAAWAADMAHEINNEVGQIRNWAYLLRERLKHDPELEDYARKIDESASVLSSTGPWNDRPPQVVKLDLFLKRNLKELAGQRNLTIKYLLGTPDIYIRVNPVEFQHVLRHLVRNAARAMSNSRVHKLTLTTRPVNGNLVEILFQDSGPGISKEVQLSIFQRPITTKGRGGFGLLLVRQMIEDMGGQIKYVSREKGQGAVFSIRFPIASLMDGNVE